MKFQLSYIIHNPESEPKAVVFIVHGMQEHKERYAWFARYLNDRGYAVITYDLPGHGQDTDKENLGYFGESDGWNTLVNSAVEIATIAKKEFPNIPCVYFGHSMGTMIGRTFLQKYDGMIDAMMLSGCPCYQSAAGLGKAIASIVVKTKGAKGHSKLLDTLATGSFNKAIENPRTDLDWLSYNEENVDAYLADEYCGVPFTNQGYLDLFMGMIQMNDKSSYRMANPTLPLFLFAGEDDPCTGGNKGWMDTVSKLRNLGYTNLEEKRYPHMRHEILNEVDNAIVMQDATDWLDGHLKHS